MAWQYADYVTLTDATARAARLRLHVAEVTAEIGPDISTAGHSRNNSGLINYRKQIVEELTSLDRATSGGRATFVRGRPV